MTKATPPCFPTATLKFLRAIGRNNDREWFAAHKAEYDASVKTPMVALVDALDREFRTMAPELDANPKTSIYRIYRDTRFSADKSPLKTHIAAHFRHRDLPKANSAGLYVHVEPKLTLIAGGMYALAPDQLKVIRAHVAENAGRFRSIVTAPAFARAFDWQGDPQARVPRGYAVDHPAAEYLKCRRFVAWVEYPAAFSTDRKFFPALVKSFGILLPLVRFLNDGLLAASRRERR